MKLIGMIKRFCHLSFSTKERTLPPFAIDLVSNVKDKDFEPENGERDILGQTCFSSPSKVVMPQLPTLT